MFARQIKQPKPNLNPTSYWDDLVQDFPTVATLDNGSRCFWYVCEVSLNPSDGTEIGINLAKETLACLTDEHQNQGILAKILEQAPTDCLIAKGFRMEIENTLFSARLREDAPVSE